MPIIDQLIKKLGFNIIKLKNACLKTLQQSVPSTYLFILSPPYCGSTLLHEILSHSKVVSPNNIFDTREGQQLPEVRRKMFIKGRWEEGFNVNWKETKKVWELYWNPSKKYHLDKSPANIMRVAEIIEHFDPISFIILVRNPYAQCESLIRINGWSAERAANFAIKCLKAQITNIDLCQSCCVLTYEQLTTQYDDVLKEISSIASEISDISFTKKYKAHNFRKEKMSPVNLNPDKIKKLSLEQMEKINSVLKHHKSLLDQFGYKLILESI